MSNHKKESGYVPPTDFTKLSRLRKMVETLNRGAGPQNDMDVSFEYLMASLFPNILNNIRHAMTDNYIAGYKKGLEDAKNEVEIPR